MEVDKYLKLVNKGILNEKDSESFVKVFDYLAISLYFFYNIKINLKELNNGV